MKSWHKLNTAIWDNKNATIGQTWWITFAEFTRPHNREFVIGSSLQSLWAPQLTQLLWLLERFYLNAFRKDHLQCGDNIFHNELKSWRLRRSIWRLTNITLACFFLLTLIHLSILVLLCVFMVKHWFPSPLGECFSLLCCTLLPFCLTFPSEVVKQADGLLSHWRFRAASA